MPEASASGLHWTGHLARLLGSGPCVLVTLLLRKGSAPRESGARMVVSAGCFAGSIGGGNLEYQVIARAKIMLEAGGAPRQALKNFGLGPALNQCCGGAVDVLFEHYAEPPPWLGELNDALERHGRVRLASRLDGPLPQKHVITPDVAPARGIEAVIEAVGGATRGDTGVDEVAQRCQDEGHDWWLEPIHDIRQTLCLFGAGHVGQAVARILAPLPFEIHWIDSRPGLFPPDLPANTLPIQCDDPVSQVGHAEPGALFVVMTHSHELDENICLAVLQRNDFEYLGLIGSATKSARFRHRLARRGIDQDRLEKLVCPIGLSEIRGKQPATIALSLAAQLMTQ